MLDKSSSGLRTKSSDGNVGLTDAQVGLIIVHETIGWCRGAFIKRTQTFIRTTTVLIRKGWVEIERIVQFDGALDWIIFEDV